MLLCSTVSIYTPSIIHRSRLQEEHRQTHTARPAQAIVTQACLHVHPCPQCPPQTSPRFLSQNTLLPPTAAPHRNALIVASTTTAAGARHEYIIAPNENTTCSTETPEKTIAEHLEVCYYDMKSEYCIHPLRCKGGGIPTHIYRQRHRSFRCVLRQTRP